MIPTKDSLLAGWSANADALLTATPGDFGSDAAQALQFHNLNVLWTDAYNAVVAARASGSQTMPLTQAKDTAKANFLRFAREIYANCQNSLTCTDANKAALGVVVKKTTQTPKPVIAFPPTLKVMSVFGRQVRLSITNGDSKAKPFGAAGCSVYSFVGDVAPTTAEGWIPEGTVMRNQVIVLLPDTVAPNTKVWFCAAYFNTRGIASPACTPIFAYTNHESAEPLSA
jgi:hypothetical protein